VTIKRKVKRRVVTVKRKARRKVATIKRNARRKVVATRRNAKRKAVTEGESIPKREGNLSPGRVPMLDEANEIARRSEADSDEYRAAVERLETARPTAARKPENPAEALAWLRTANRRACRGKKSAGPVT
jgi:hypothetical protein